MATKTTKAKTKKPAPLLSKAYLIWVGSEFYKSIDDWAAEAAELGVSKRIPNAGVGRAMMEPGSVVFVAHDEGCTRDCDKCLGSIECPECRKRISDMVALRKTVDTIKGRLKGDWETEAPESMKRSVSVREAQIEELEGACEKCPLCRGKGRIKAGTGGKVTLKDGRKWDYRTFNYWLHQPSKFHAETMVETREMCETCGGTGEIPEARLFGVFVPERLEYIVRGDESREELAKIKDLTKVKIDELKAEPKRKCGVRKPGGVYVVTTPGESPRATKVLPGLSELGITAAGAEVHGQFIRFLKPVAVEEKRFRGIKSIDLKTISEAARAQAEMIKDAVAS